MSKLINKTRLTKFANDFWTKIKGRYDNAFVDAEIPTAEKKIKFTKAGGGATKDVSLEDYARLQDRNKFKQDVSVDNVAIESNAYVNNVYSNNSVNRCLGFRSLTSKNFVDGHISTLRVLVDSDLANDTVTSWKLWAIKKDNTNRTGDTVKKAYGTLSKNVKTVTINGETHKAIDFEINEEFTDEVYFIVKSNGNRFRITYPNDPYKDDVVNLSNPPSDTVDTVVNWDTNANRTNTAIMYLYGRESIKSLSEKLKQTQADGSNYVLKSETTATGGTGNENKVVKLDGQGKLSESMLPAIALNEFFPVTANTWNEAALNNITYQNGDIIYHTNTQKRYLCINKNASFEDRFVELNSKDGVVQSVNGKVGAVTLRLEADDEKFKLKISGTGGAEVVEEIPMISEQDITNILDSLPQ